MKHSFTQKLRLIGAVLSLAAISLAGHAQFFLPNDFSQSITPYVPLDSGIVLVDDGYIDDQVVGISFPFAFQFNGGTYTQGYLNTNGYITLGAVVPAVNDVNPLSSNAAYNGVIAAWGRDIRSLYTSPLPSTIQYQVFGEAPNRIIVYQWENFHPYTGTGDYEISFQIKLAEFNGGIEFHYQVNSTLVENSFNKTVQIGIRGANNTQVVCRTNGPSQSFNSSTVSTVTANQIFNTFLAVPGMPANGLKYSYGVFGCTNSAACNYNPGAAVNDGTCCFSQCGCTDPEACNFDPGANCQSFNSCVYPGCMDTLACNYDPNATCDDGSCLTLSGCADPFAANYTPNSCGDMVCTYRINGHVFHDTNTNGWQEEGEEGIPGQTLTIEPLGIIVTTNNLGNYSFFGIPAGNYVIQHTASTLFPVRTTPHPIQFYIGTNNTAPPTVPKLGLNELGAPVTINFSGDYSPAVPGYPCDVWHTHSFCIWLSGNAAIDHSQAIVEFDSLITGIQIPLGGITYLPDSTVGNLMYFSIPNMTPNSMFWFQISVHTPNFEHIGEWVTNHLTVLAYDDDNNLVATGEKTIEVLVTCAYDPNAISSEPRGYDEPHYINTTQNIEYTVQFQNTGNAPATNVIIRDTLDADLDISKFSMGPVMHNCYTQLNPTTREVMFFFENIMLPDSTSNEPGSHGQLTYFIKPLPNKPHNTQLLSTAHIYFDNNPAVVTNTNLLTIFNCSSLTSVAGNTIVCHGANNVLTGEQNYVDQYTWSIAGNVVSNESTFNTSQLAPGTYTLHMNLVNPFCNVTKVKGVTIKPLPTLFAGDDVTVCAGEPVTLNATSTTAVTWSNAAANGSSIMPTQSITLTANTNGTNGCSNSDAITINVNPSPTIAVENDMTVCSGESLILNATSDNTVTWSNGHTNGTSYTPTDSEVLTATASNSFDCTAAEEVNITVAPVPLIAAGNDVTICAGETIMLNATGADGIMWSNALENGTDYAPTQTQTLTASFENEYGCSDTDDMMITVNPTPTLNVDAQQTVCGGESIMLNAISNGTVLWSNGHTNNTSYTPAQSETITASVTNAFDCSVMQDVAIEVIPAQTINAGADIALCTGDEITLNATGADQIIWSNGAVNGSTITPSQTITLTATPAVVNECTVTDQIVITVTEQANVSAGADISICYGDYILLNATGANNLTWSNNATNGSPYQPQQTETIAVNGGIGNCADSDELVITVNPIPDITITQNGDAMTAPIGATWQWYFNGNIIDGATDQTYTATEPGYYFVETTNAEGCTQESQVVFVLSVLEHGSISAVLFPNPMETSATLQLVGLNGVYDATLLNLQGQIVRSYASQTTHMLAIEKGSLAAGHYYLNITQNETSLFTLKLEVK